MYNISHAHTLYTYMLCTYTCVYLLAMSIHMHVHTVMDIWDTYMHLPNVPNVYMYMSVCQCCVYVHVASSLDISFTKANSNSWFV